MPGKLDLKNYYEWPLLTRMVAMLFICLIVFYLVYRWDITTLKHNLMKEQTKETELKKEVAATIKLEIKEANKLTRYDALLNLLNDWKKQLITYADLTELLNSVLKIGATNHIYFVQFAPGQTIQENNYMKVPIRLIAVGKYHQLASFISQIANLPWIIVVGDFTITNDSRNDVIGAKLASIAAAQNLLTADITFNVYRLPRLGEIKIPEKPKEDPKKKKPAKSKAKTAKGKAK